ncbi:transcriptional regulator, partial [Paenibacillus macerans]
MEDKKGTAATRAKNKYNAANYDRLYPYVPKG